MTLVRVIKDWNYPDLLRQTPGGAGQWDNICFTLDAVPECDYVIVLNRIPQATMARCPAQHVWVIMQEPPVVKYRWHRKGFDLFFRVYTQNTTLGGERFVFSQPALPWHVDKSYDELKRFLPPNKLKALSWITSSRSQLSGHKARLAFLAALQAGAVEFDLWGKGFAPIVDKWDGLMNYRYSLAVENYAGPYYWSEKLADCYLSWAMPIYHGCANIVDYFPPESLIKIDIQKPAEAIEIIRETLQSDRWRRNRDAIAYARELVLDRYQFFPFVTELIHQFEAANPVYPAQTIKLPKLLRGRGLLSKRRSASRFLRRAIGGR